MRKLIATLVATIAVIGFAGTAHAYTVETGQGVDAPGGPNPVDPTAGLANQLPDNGVLFIGADANTSGGAVAIALGNEGDDMALGRLGLFATPDSAGFYAEDYTPGNAIASGIAAGNEALGCPIIPCGAPGDDAILGVGGTGDLPALPTPPPLPTPPALPPVPPLPL